ncbi:SURF1 family protein [Octadecabacter sp. R77987]|uniref:SURF1 family protein n=1 Tax=Octadecabacter sp. R77987 TaxID=3093874 RepID=UPI00366B00B0
MARLIFPLVLGLGGIAILLWLGFWQVDRLAWKEGVLADINARLAAAPLAVPDDPGAARDAYMAVEFAGVPVGEELHVLTSGTAQGTGYRAITALQLQDGRRILLDQGLIALDAKDAPRSLGPLNGTGNLVWPDDVNASTPAPDLGKNIWFGRDVAAMAAALDTLPIMVVLNNADGLDARIAPLPVDTSGIKNDHLNYAITWFLLAVVWAIMTLFWITRILRTKD